MQGHCGGGRLSMRHRSRSDRSARHEGALRTSCRDERLEVRLVSRNPRFRTHSEVPGGPYSRCIFRSMYFSFTNMLLATRLQVCCTCKVIFRYLRSDNSRFPGSRTVKAGSELMVRSDRCRYRLGSNVSLVSDRPLVSDAGGKCCGFLKANTVLKLRRK